MERLGDGGEGGLVDVGEEASGHCVVGTRGQPQAEALEIWALSSI